ncbi:uncharacterized protein CANTADRAFT_5991 [Suhomyces tanzawaensis NRRL Y-17324]|uniref:Small ribosomal subunit protein mS35 n=1 Tax=Suhomyces tanzawaensis NRRL Y-17324 TaxID=984487 RepID=A0A1E4SLF4_9ASCO|nr:uncharacterized protein CANTADRAFT_5991 [Suhomyces tanzawaensis NRRL Y-17324]ODV80351.1 hypothetical protein CANTADRAFT_5991 [Suhomyces tanzawaensis NRRL Y-17324]
MRSIRSIRPALRFYSKPADGLYLNPHQWKGLPADQIFELHNIRKAKLGEHYNPNDEERMAILSTMQELSRAPAPALEYVYEIDNFKERFLTEKQNETKGQPAKKSNILVANKGQTPHEKRRIENLTRISAYEMPLLAKFRQPYQPKSNTPLKITYNTDFTDESTNDFNRKVSLHVQIEELGLDDKQLHKFKVLAGNKLNLNTNVFRLRSSQFPEASQNVRWLVDTFNQLLNEAKDLTNDFADIPVDARHMRNHARKPVPTFPEAWKRPQDAPVEKHSVVQKLVEKVKKQKDIEYVINYSP